MDLSQDIQRKAAIKAVKLEHKSASSKRAVSILISLFWDKISKAALDDNTDVVTMANIDEVNAALIKQAK